MKYWPDVHAPLVDWCLLKSKCYMYVHFSKEPREIFDNLINIEKNIKNIAFFKEIFQI